MENTGKKALLKKIGKRIQEQRKKIGYQPEDIAEMTGMTALTIRNIESGRETHLGSFLAVCLAIEMHPKDLLDIELSLKPLYKLSEPRKEKTRLTFRIDHFVENDYFKEERTARDVVNELAARYEITTNTSAVSVILNRKVEQEELRALKKGRKKFYRE